MNHRKHIQDHQSDSTEFMVVIIIMISLSDLIGYIKTELFANDHVPGTSKIPVQIDLEIFGFEIIT